VRARDLLVTEVAHGVDLSLRDIGVLFRGVEMRDSYCDGGFDHCRLEAE
jgi:hypothetical protein